jgi:DNA-binding transcriptional regulator YiaG
MRSPTASEVLALRKHGQGLTQRSAAKRWGVKPEQVWQWEHGVRHMRPERWRAILAGCVALPIPDPDTIRRARRLARLTQGQSAKLLGLAVITWQKWEEGTYKMDGLKWALYLELTGLPTSLNDPLERFPYNPG